MAHTTKFVADVLYLFPTFFTVQIRCPKHIRWRHHHFAFHSQQMTRRDCNFTICIIDCSNNQRSWADYSLDFCKQSLPRFSKLLLLVFRRDDKMLLADLTCLSQTPPMWLAKRRYLFHTILSAFWLSINLWILLWFISSIDFAHSL